MRDDNVTKQTRIPIPPAAGPAKGQETLIERVVRNYDLVRVTAAPIPDDLIPPTGKRRRYRRAEPVAEIAEVAEVVDAGPQFDQAPVSAIPPEVVTPEVVTPEVVAPQAAASDLALPEAAMAPAAGSALVPAIQPVQFKGPVHRVARAHLRDLGLIEPEGAVTALFEEFRIVKRQLLFNANQLQQQGMGYAAQRVLICSPHPGEGKTFTAVNLALAIAAEKETEVVLVDADLAKPSVLSSLGLPGGKGLMDALADPSIDIADCVLGTDISGLWVVPAGSATTTDSEYLSSSRTRQVLDRLVEGAPNRFVIFDSPPALAASPAAELAKYVGQSVVVARADRTGQGALEDAIQLLAACPNIQLLLNAVHFSPSGRRFGSYYGYGG